MASPEPGSTETSSTTSLDKTTIPVSASNLDAWYKTTPPHDIAIATCTTAAATAAKVATINNISSWKLEIGAEVLVKFTYTNTGKTPTLNVNSTGAKKIWYGSSALGSSNLGRAGTANYYGRYIYDGTYWVWLGHGVDSNTTYTPMALGGGLGTCETEADAVDKVVTLTSYSLINQGRVSVRFAYSVPAAATLNINAKGAIPIYHRGSAITDGVINAGDIATFVYDSTANVYNLTAIENGIKLADINTAISNANTAADTANQAALDANAATSEAVSATNTANQAALDANIAESSANNATDAANQAASDANSAAELANTAADAANTATQEANAAAQSASTAASDADALVLDITSQRDSGVFNGAAGEDGDGINSISVTSDNTSVTCDVTKTLVSDHLYDYELAFTGLVSGQSTSQIPWYKPATYTWKNGVFTYQPKLDSSTPALNATGSIAIGMILLVDFPNSTSTLPSLDSLPTDTIFYVKIESIRWRIMFKGTQQNAGKLADLFGRKNHILFVVSSADEASDSCYLEPINITGHTIISGDSLIDYITAVDEEDED